MNWLNVDKEFKQRFKYGAVVILAVIAGIYIFLQSTTYILVIISALILASVMVSLINFLREKTNTSYVAMFIASWLIVIGLPAGLLYISAPTLDGQFEALKQNVQQLADPETELPSWIPAREFIKTELSTFDTSSFLNESGIAGRLSSLAFSVSGVITALAVLMLVAIYVSLNPKLYIETMLSFINKDKKSMIEKKLTILSSTLSSWIIARLFSMAAVAVLTYVGLLIIGVPQALFLALLAGIVSFVPNIGPIIAIIPAGIVALLQSPMLLLYVVILYISIQIIESYFLTPLIEQRLVSTPPAILISFQLILGVLFGLMGLVLAAPLLSVIFALRDAEGEEE